MSLICPKCGKQYKSPSFYQKHVEKCTGAVTKTKIITRPKRTARIKPKKPVEKNLLINLKNKIKNLEERVSKLESIIQNANLDAYLEPSDIENKEIVDYNGVSLFHKDFEFLIDLEKEIGEIPLVSYISWNNFGYKTENIRIVGLSLYNKDLNFIPESIGSLFSLKELYLDNNQLSLLPEGFKKLKSLTILNLGHNKLKSFPESIGDLTSLEELTLWSNDIVEIPKSLGNLILLKKLYLFDNKIKLLPDSLGNLKYLKILDLKQNNLKSLPDSIIKLKFLKKLLIKSNKLEPFSESIMKWLNYLEQKGCKIFK
jgi:Leucine-rich repeat (LRR) protein